MIVSIFPEMYPGEANTTFIPTSPIPQPKQALQDQKNYLQGRALHLIIATHHPLSIKSGPITAHSTFTVRNICIFASQIQRNYNVSYIIQK